MVSSGHTFMMKSRATVLSWGILRHGMNRNTDNKFQE